MHLLILVSFLRLWAWQPNGMQLRGVSSCATTMAFFRDEVGSIESDGQYALLWEVLRRESQQRWFLIVGASATISPSMAQELRKIDAAWVCCRERRFPLERNLLQVSSLQLFYDAIVHIACALLRRGSSCLVFLPGKQEIHPCMPASNIAS